MGINWFWRRRSNKKNVTTKPQGKRCSLEPLENRQMMAVTPVVVTSSVADNRGYVQVRFNKTLQSSTINNTSVRVFTAGNDGTIGTTDDVQVSSTLIYSASKTLTINGHVNADQGYRVKLYSSRIKDTDGLRLDGEFHVGSAGGASGNGVQGGDYQFRVKRDVGATPIARMTSNMGDIDVRLYRAASAFSNVATPLAVANFLKYVNAGVWDNVWVNRLINGFIAQLGSFNLTAGGSLNEVASKTNTGDLLGEPGNSNVAGTLAFALPSESFAQQQGLHSKDAGTQDFFFNFGDNSFLDTLQNDQGPFTVFGKVANSKGMAVLTAMSQLKRLDLSAFKPGDGRLTTVGVRPQVPVEGDVGGSFPGGTTTKNLETLKDLVVFTHIGVLSKLVAIT